MVQLRTGTAASTAVATRAAFLMSDGSIHDIDGSNHVNFIGLSTGSYYIVVIHRNHLAVMSHNPVLYPIVQHMILQLVQFDICTWHKSNGKFRRWINYGMYAGDANGNGVINVIGIDPI